MAADDKAKRVKGEAFIPGRWVEKEIRNLELDVPFVAFIDPEHEKDPSHAAEYRLWVDENNRPMLSGNVPIPDSGRDFDAGDLVGGRFGLMRTLDQLTGELKEGFVVDLRYANPGDVVQVDTSVFPDDTEELTDMLDFKEAAIPVAAIAISKHTGDPGRPGDTVPEKEKRKWGLRSRIDDDEVQRDYEVFGQPEFYPALDYLMAALDAEIDKAQNRARGSERGVNTAKTTKKLGESGTVLARFFSRFR